MVKCWGTWHMCSWTSIFVRILYIHYTKWIIKIFSFFCLYLINTSKLFGIFQVWVNYYSKTVPFEYCLGALHCTQPQPRIRQLTWELFRWWWSNTSTGRVGHRSSLGVGYLFFVLACSNHYNVILIVNFAGFTAFLPRIIVCFLKFLFCKVTRLSFLNLLNFLPKVLPGTLRSGNSWGHMITFLQEQVEVMSDGYDKKINVPVQEPFLLVKKKKKSNSVIHDVCTKSFSTFVQNIRSGDIILSIVLICYLVWII